MQMVIIFDKKVHEPQVINQMRSNNLYIFVFVQNLATRRATLKKLKLFTVLKIWNFLIFKVYKFSKSFNFAFWISWTMEFRIMELLLGKFYKI